MVLDSGLIVTYFPFDTLASMRNLLGSSWTETRPYGEHSDRSYMPDATRDVEQTRYPVLDARVCHAKNSADANEAANQLLEDEQNKGKWTLFYYCFGDCKCWYEDFRMWGMHNLAKTDRNIQNPMRSADLTAGWTPVYDAILSSNPGT